MKLRSFQFKTGVNGWGDGKEIGTIIHNITHEQATTICYGLALIMKKETRFSDVTGYEDLEIRNNKGETLGNGNYMHPSNAVSYFLKSQF